MIALATNTSRVPQPSTNHPASQPATSNRGPTGTPEMSTANLRVRRAQAPHASTASPDPLPTPHSPLPPDLNPDPHPDLDLEELMHLLADANVQIIDIATRLKVGVTTLARIISTPQIQQAIEALQQISAARERIIAAQTRPEIIQALAFNATRESAKPETQRKAAALLAKLLLTPKSNTHKPSIRKTSTTKADRTKSDAANAEAALRLLPARGEKGSAQQTDEGRLNLPSPVTPHHKHAGSDTRIRTEGVRSTTTPNPHPSPHSDTLDP